MYWWFTSIYADLCYSHSYPTCMRHTFESLSAHFRWAARSDCWGPTLAHFNFRASDEAGCEELIRMRFLVSPSKTSNNLGWSWMSSEKKIHQFFRLDLEIPVVKRGSSHVVPWQFCSARGLNLGDGPPRWTPPLWLTQCWFQNTWKYIEYATPLYRSI